MVGYVWKWPNSGWDIITSTQWFRLVPLTRFGPILKKKKFGRKVLFLVRAKAKAKVVLKHKLPNNDYRRCTR